MICYDTEIFRPASHYKRTAREPFPLLHCWDGVFTPDHIQYLLRFAQQGSYEWVAGNFLEERAPGALVLGSGPIASSQSERLTGLMRRSVTSTWFYRSYLRCIKANFHAWRYNLNGDQSHKKRLIRSGVRMGYVEHIVTHKLLVPGEKFLYTTLALDSASRRL